MHGPVLGSSGDTVGTKTGLALPSEGSQSSGEDRPGIKNDTSNSPTTKVLHSAQRGVLVSSRQGSFLRHQRAKLGPQGSPYAAVEGAGGVTAAAQGPVRRPPPHPDRER